MTTVVVVDRAEAQLVEIDAWWLIGARRQRS